MQHSLLSKNALVTGASRGIGKATALALGAAGAYVLVHCNRGLDEAQGVVTEIRDRGGRADVLVADLASAEGPRILAAEVGERVRRLDVLVASAGIAQTATLEDTRIEDFDRLFAVNVRAPFFLVQQLLPLLGEGSSLVLISSLGARSAVGDIPAYAATKGALDTLVLHFAQALGGRGIRVNGLAPGVVDTEMSSFVRSDEGRDFVLGIQALQRIAQPEDIADAALFLASDASRWITGDILSVDGGTKL
ncbi:SDR family oxidoreductase [Pseudomonas sp. No.21]|uniref:SDR family NAD(P)-dependent oxidoreductase n=1 Tax=Pseudomonas TaxID=286 RepID=UPI000DA73F1B|nr:MULTISPECIES: SDR family oxidoreductase [Pseudomonas]MDW3713647.1 SDR family oxidoreductase [Pseudomonas sp. 2023EL-01195]PZE14977.1 oxidoreductase [Pseudomonas sp. 57B-090624]GJN45445.1 short-chain dehydrogenase [Pseudomonas tohonis]